MAGQQLHLFSNRRERRVLAPREFEMQCVFASICRRWMRPRWRFTHIPLGEHRTKGTAVRLYRMGVVAGWPDFIFCGEDRGVVFVELKREGGGRLSPEQVEIGSHLMACGFTYIMSDNIRDVVAQLKDLGILRASVSV